MFWALFSEVLLREFKPARLYLVDPWDLLHGETFRFILGTEALTHNTDAAQGFWSDRNFNWLACVGDLTAALQAFASETSRCTQTSSIPSLGR